MIDGSVIAYALKYDDINSLQRAGVSNDHFLDEWRTAWRYLCRMKRQHDTLPSRDTFTTRFPDLTLPRVRKAELPMLLDELRKRAKFMRYVDLLGEAASQGLDYENVSDKIQWLQGNLNALAFESTERSHLRDVFSREVRREMTQEIRRRRRGGEIGIPTGLKRFDRENGGLVPQKMVVIIGRTGIGKSWLDLLFIAKSIMNGNSSILYPLEMTMAETVFRLYTIFSQEMFGGSRTIRNLDLQRGNVPVKKAVKFLHILEDKFAGQLMVADVGAMADPYTMERIEAEVEAHHPDMFWVDYLTLVKPPVGSNREDSWLTVQLLSNSIKQIAMRRNVVGGCSAQVNREALKQRVFLPRLEHIAFGDSIGHDADQVFSINRKGDYLFYSLVKNRGGAEIPKMRLKFAPNEGLLREDRNQPEDEDDD